MAMKRESEPMAHFLLMQNGTMVFVKFLKSLLRFFSLAGGVFLLGAIIGALFFGAQFGFSVVNLMATDWIWHGVTHDTAQHYIGWEFFRADSSGGIINELAYPEGLPITFMDAIPLIALPLKLIANVLPTGFQYFGLWALICYVLIGGLGAVLTRKIFILARSNKNCHSELVSESTKSPRKILKQVQDDKHKILQTLFVTAGALIFVLSPMVLARTLYHPALAAHWLILSGILLIWDAPKFAKWWKFVLVWSAMLVGAVLIHPYFLPMLSAMMVIAALRNENCHSELVSESIKSPKKILKRVQDDKIWKIVMKFLAKIIIPTALAVLAFASIGGFALGSGAEIHDLHEKGFNLLSFANPSGYSVIPGFANASYSSETLMWLGLGVWIMIITAAILWRGQYKKSFKEFKRKFAAHKACNIATAVVAFGLLVFAIGVRVDVGPLAVFQWQPPEKIYEFWSAFRAAAREAWPFYYATILFVIYWFARVINRRETVSSAHSIKFRDEKVTSEIHESRSKYSRFRKFQSSNFFRKFREVAERNSFAILAVAFCAVALIQFADIWFSKNATTRREGFAIARTTEPRFVPIDIDDLITTQKHLVMLDGGFRYDQNGTYEIARTALKNNLTLNIGFFARIPDPIWKQQTVWCEKVKNGELTTADLHDYIFATTNEKLAVEIADNYTVTKRGKFYFITLAVR